jgi:hypothetical protein
MAAIKSITPASVYQAASHADQSDWGVAATPTNAFRAVNVQMAPKVEVATVRAAGERFNTGTYLKKSWSEGTLEGSPSFNELEDTLRWFVGSDPDVTDLLDGNERLDFSVKENDVVIRTLHIGNEDDGVAEVQGAYVTNFSFEFGANSGDAKVSASIMGQEYTEGTFVAPTNIPDVDIATATTVNVYLGTEIGVYEQLTDALMVSFDSGEMRNPVYVLDRATGNTFHDVVDTSMEGATLTLKSKTSEKSRALLERLKNSETSYAKVEAVHPVDGRVFSFELALRGTDHTTEDQDAAHTFTVIEDENEFSHTFSITQPLTIP